MSSQPTSSRTWIPPPPRLDRIVNEWVAASATPPPDGQPTVQFLSALNAAIYRDVAYSVRMEAGVQTPEETLTQRIGSCRDTAWLLVTALRQSWSGGSIRLGLPRPART